MRVHEIEYFKKKGRKQEHFFKKGEIDNGKVATVVDASSTLVCDEGYLIGGRLDVRKTIDAAKKLHPVIENALDTVPNRK